MRSKRRSLLAVSATFALAAGCGGGSAPGPSVTVRDSAGIAIVENPSPDDSLALPWWHLEGPELDVGGIAAEEPYAVFRVRDALRREDGSIVVANAGSGEIRIYGAEGRHVRSSGGLGDGPGEYRSPADLERGPGDSLLALDERARRVSLLDSRGDFVRAFSVAEIRTVRRLVGRSPTGGLLTAPTTSLANPTAANPDEVHRPAAPLVDLSLDGMRADTLGLFPGLELVVRVQQGSTVLNVLLFPPAFGKAATYAVHGEAVYVGLQDAPEVRVYDGSLVLRRIVRTGRAIEPRTDAHVDAYVEARIRGLPEERRAAARASGQFRTVPFGDLVPPYGDIATDAAGRLWVSDYDDPTDPPGRWTVYDPEGRVLARIALPERFTPFDIGETWILGRELDELDVEHVRLYRIVKT